MKPAKGYAVVTTPDGEGEGTDLTLTQIPKHLHTNKSLREALNTSATEPLNEKTDQIVVINLLPVRCSNPENVKASNELIETWAPLTTAVIEYFVKRADVFIPMWGKESDAQSTWQGRALRRIEVPLRQALKARDDELGGDGTHLRTGLPIIYAENDGGTPTHPSDGGWNKHAFTAGVGALEASLRK